MKLLIKKEFFLGWKWYNYLFFIFPVMILIPNYPLFTGMIYVFFFVTTLFPAFLSNNDYKFMSGLPIRRKDIVFSKYFDVLLGQSGTLILSSIMILIKVFAMKETDIPLMDPNFAFVGMTLIEYAVFNLIFMPTYFSDLKLSKSILLSLSGFFISIGILELLVQVVPSLKTVLDTLDVAYIGWRIGVLVGGVVIYAGGSFLAFRLACKKFFRYNM